MTPPLLKQAITHIWFFFCLPLLAVAAKQARAKPRKRGEAAATAQSLKIDSQQRFRALFDQSSVGVALESLEGEIYNVNPAFARLLGYSEDEMRRMKCAEFSHPEDEEAEMVLFKELREGQRPSYQVDKRFKHRMGRWVWARVSVSLLKTEGETPLVVGFIEDIQDRREAEEQLRQAKIELEQLAGRLLTAQEQERRRISRELHDDIGQRMSLATNDIARIEQDLRGEHKIMLARQASALRNQLSDLASSIHDLCSNLHSTKLEHLGLRAALNELCSDVKERSGLSLLVEVDDDANNLQEDVALCLYRVVQEALNNVTKHSQSPGAEIMAKREGDFIRLKVQDYGRGFDPASLQHSSGIGLASMRERLRMIHGNLVIRSGIGLGTEVIAKIRLVPRPRQSD